MRSLTKALEEASAFVNNGDEHYGSHQPAYVLLRQISHVRCERPGRVPTFACFRVGVPCVRVSGTTATGNGTVGPTSPPLPTAGVEPQA